MKRTDLLILAEREIEMLTADTNHSAAAIMRALVELVRVTPEITTIKKDDIVRQTPGGGIAGATLTLEEIGGEKTGLSYVEMHAKINPDQWARRASWPPVKTYRVYKDNTGKMRRHGELYSPTSLDATATDWEIHDYVPKPPK
jgi:hypothetical protein